MILKRIGSSYIGIRTGSININNVDATIKKLSLFSGRGCFVQFCPLKSVSSLNQLVFAAEQAVDSFSTGTNSSKKPELEFLLRLTGTRQINKAIGKVPLEKGRNQVVMLAVAGKKEKALELANAAGTATGFREDTKLAGKIGKNKAYLKKIYCLGEGELASLKDKENALEEAVLGKIALAALEG